MDGPRLMSGSELVAKGATKKVDGQLPQTGLKEVLADGSWLEQKQIQSALEARKHLIAVERIEKSGSISHAEWRDELKLAEVTKQTGGHWQYIGHKKGKHLYMLPEETLFLMEVNSLLLKHNEVTVSLQKAYALCLTEMPLIQYKVYASLSRLGYRVCRHKVPKPIEETDSQTTSKENCMETEINDTKIEAKICEEETNDTTTNENVQENASTKNDNVIDDMIVQDTGNGSNCNEKDYNTEPCDITVVQNSNADANISKDGDSATNIDSEAENNKMEVADNNNTSSVDNFTNNADKEVLVNGDMQINGKTDTNIDTTNTENIKTIEPSCIDKELSTNDDTLVSNQEKVDIISTAMDVVEGNTESTLDCNIDTVAIKLKCAENLPQAINPEIVYSIDETGVVRPGDQIIILETNTDLSKKTNEQVNPIVPKTKDSESNKSSNHYQVEIKHYDQKIQKICERKTADQTNSKGLDTLQDLYKERIVDVNVPEETYLPRNIFLHRTAYRLNIDDMQNQNASNVSSDEMDSVESPSRTPNVTNIQNIQNHTYPPNYGNNNTNNLPRYPGFRFDRPYYRYNFQMFRPPLQGFVPRWRADFMRHQYMAYQANRRDTMKSYHYNTIVNIATRFKCGFVANPSQVRALHSLLNTYNLRYNATIGITPDFNIIDTKMQQHNPTVESVIVLDDEPKRKKQRLNYESDKSNLDKLKELAAKLKYLHARDLDTSRHRRVFSNAIKSYNKSFKADIYLNDNFEIVDRKLVVLDSSSDSEAVVVKDTERPRKRKKLRNPYSILRQSAQIQNNDPSTSTQVIESQRLPQAENENYHQIIEENHANTAFISVDDEKEGLLKYFDKAWLPEGDDFGRAEPCSKQKAHLDALIYQAEYLQDILKEANEFQCWKDIKIAVLKEIRGSLDVQKQQAEALSNDFYMETESQIRPILEKGCTDLKTALKKLSVIPTNKEVLKETSLRIHFDVCNRDVPFKKSSPPKPNFRVVCYEESSPFPPSGEVAALYSKYQDGIPTVFAFVGVSASITYLQINPTELPIFIPELQ